VVELSYLQATTFSVLFAAGWFLAGCVYVTLRRERRAVKATAAELRKALTPRKAHHHAS
jgi:hypothetical protein